MTVMVESRGAFQTLELENYVKCFHARAHWRTDNN